MWRLFNLTPLVADSEYVEEYRVQVLSGLNVEPLRSCQYDKFIDIDTFLGDKAFQIEVQYVLLNCTLIYLILTDNVCVSPPSLE